jgi:uncharacterized radical SAM superfamily Fe-S cluster-containing enzyme
LSRKECRERLTWIYYVDINLFVKKNRRQSAAKSSFTAENSKGDTR